MLRRIERARQPASGFQARRSVGPASPIRLLEAVVTGVSFLGAGTILRERRGGRVHGLTTAASLLLTAATGASVALEQLGVALGATLIGLVTLRGVGWLEDRWRRAEGRPR